MDEWKSARSLQKADAIPAKEVKIILWRNKAISFATKVKLYKSLVSSLRLFGCESWTLTLELERQIQAFEHKYYRNMLGM